LHEEEGFTEKRRYDEYESIFASPDNASDNDTFKSDVCDTTQKNMSEADMTAKTEVIEDDDKGAQVSTARDEINQQLVDLIGEIKVLLTDIRAGLPVAAAHNVSTEQEPAVRSETKTTNSTVSDNSSYLKDDLAEHLNEVSQEELETIPKVVKEYLDEAEQVIEREENRIEPQKTMPPKKKLKLWHIIIPVLFLVAATASFLFIYAPERQKAVPQPVQAKKEMMPAVQKTPETRPVAAPEVNKSAVAAAPMIAGQHTVELIASESTWLSATIDEKSSKEMMLKAGDKVKLTAKNNVSLIIGNAAGLKVIFDGKEISPMGGKGKVARLRLP
jgi:hypothetical protein